MDKIKLIGKNYYLENLQIDDVTERYVNWLNDPEVNRFLEVRFIKSTLENTRNYVETFDNKSRFLFGIYTMHDNQHIGNMALHINKNHNTADFGYLIGEKDYWGKSASKEAIILLLDYSFNTLNIRKVWGGSYAENIRSIPNFKKLGFVQEARLREDNFDGEKITDGLRFSILQREWIEKEELTKKAFLA